MTKNQSKNINLFEQSIRSPYTRTVYMTCLQKYLQFPSSGKFLAFKNSDPRKVEEHIISFVISMKKQGKSFAAIYNYISAICKYYKMNYVYLNTNKIKQYLPEFKKSKKDRAYTHAEIQTLLDIVDDRFRAIILLLSSTGMRVGAIPDLRLKNIEKISSSEFVIYKITVYEGFNEEYITFTTPECTQALDSYLTMRSRYGEKLDASSWLIREQFDIRDPFAISKCNEIKGNTLTRKLIDLAERAGIRQKDVLEEGKHRATIRKEVAIAHGFRKLFTTQLIEADVKTELRWLLEGHKLKANDSNYVRVSEKRLQEEYEKAIDNLTIDPANRLQRKVAKLEVEKSELEKIAQDVAIVKKRLKLK